MDLSSLKNLFDIDIDLDIRNISLVNYEEHGKLLKDGDDLLINVEKLNTAEREEIIELTQDHFDNDERVLRDDVEEETNDMIEGYSEQNDEVLSYYDGIIAERYHEMLRYSLRLRALIEMRDLTRDEINRRKREIADKTGQEAIYIASLCSAGYFDINSDLHDIYVTMGLNEEYDKVNFYKEFKKLVEEKLVAVFVETDDKVRDVRNEVRGRLKTHQQTDTVHDWLDIRGIGDQCRDTINSVVEDLEDEFIGIDYDRYNVEDDTYVRIHLHSLPPIN